MMYKTKFIMKKLRQTAAILLSTILATVWMSSCASTAPQTKKVDPQKEPYATQQSRAYPMKDDGPVVR